MQRSGERHWLSSNLTLFLYSLHFNSYFPAPKQIQRRRAERARSPAQQQHPEPPRRCPAALPGGRGGGGGCGPAVRRCSGSDGGDGAALQRGSQRRKLRTEGDCRRSTERLGFSATQMWLSDKPHAIPSSFCISFFSGLNVPRKNKLSISLHELKPLHYTVQYRKCKMSPHQIGYTSDMVKYGSCFACKTQSESRPSRTAVQPPRSRRPGAPSPSAPFVEILTGKTKKKVLRGKGKKNRLRLRKFSIYALPQVWCQFLSAADAEAPAQGLRCTWLRQQGLPSSFCFPSRAGCSPAPRSSPAPLGTQLLCRATHTHRAWKK